MARLFRSPIEAVALTLVLAVALAAVLVSPAQSAAARKIHVDDDAAPGGTGSGHSPYNNLHDALADAKATSADVVINVAPGDYPVGSSLVIDRPLKLLGSSVLTEDAEGWPTGDTVAGTQTRIVSTNTALADLIRVGRSDGVVLENVSVEGFVLEGTATGISVSLTRVQNYLVKGNVVRAPARLGVQSVASSGLVKGNHFRGIGTGVIVNAGNTASPAAVTVSGNRSVNNSLGGVLLAGSSVNIPEVGDRLDAVVRDNDLSGNTSPNQGFGLRLFLMSPTPGVSQSGASIYAVVQDNLIDRNRIGVQVDAGFPYRSVSGVCEARTYTGVVDVTFAGNALTGSLQAPALVSFTRNTAALSPSQLPLWQYLHAATYTISDRDGALASARIDHPASDPLTGACPGDATSEPLENVLVYNGVALQNGRNF